MTIFLVRILSRTPGYAILNLIMAISIPSFGGIISRFIPGKAAVNTQTTTNPEQTSTSSPLTETQRAQGIQELNQEHRELLTPAQALKLDDQYLNSTAEVHPNTREATTDEIVGARTLGDHNWYAKREAEVKGETFPEGPTPNLYDTAKEVLPSPTTDKGEGKV